MIEVSLLYMRLSLHADGSQQIYVKNYILLTKYLEQHNKGGFFLGEGICTRYLMSCVLMLSCVLDSWLCFLYGLYACDNLMCF